MEINRFKKISLLGRIAYSIRCFENTLLFLKYNIKEWEIVLVHLWNFGSKQYLDDWIYSVNEIIPDHLLEFKNYENHNFEYLSKEEFVYLYNLYKDSNKLINDVMELIYFIASSHIYTIIIGYGEESFNNLQILIEYMISNNIPLPEVDTFESLSFKENQGFGNKFNATSLSQLLD